MPAPRARLIGPGRAGGAFATALDAVGWEVTGVLGRPDDVAGAARDVELLLIATPDAAIASVAAAVEPVPTTVVAHVAGSLGLDVLAPHPRRGALHPLLPLPDATVGATRLRGGAWFAVAGDPLVERVVRDLGGRSFAVADEARPAYHAAAAIASNHLVAILGQAERVALAAGVPFEAYLDLVQATVDNVRALGPAAGPVSAAARGDWATIERHRAALAVEELAAYDALVELARRLVEPPDPAGDDG